MNGIDIIEITRNGSVEFLKVDYRKDEQGVVCAANQIEIDYFKRSGKLTEIQIDEPTKKATSAQKLSLACMKDFFGFVDGKFGDLRKIKGNASKRVFKTFDGFVYSEDYFRDDISKIIDEKHGSKHRFVAMVSDVEQMTTRWKEPYQIYHLESYRDKVSIKEWDGKLFSKWNAYLFTVKVEPPNNKHPFPSLKIINGKKLMNNRTYEV